MATKKGIISVYIDGWKINIEGIIVPDLYHNIISVKKLMIKNYKIIFNKYGAKILDKEDR